MSADNDKEISKELINQRVTTMESDIKEIKDDIKEMPDKIVQKINETVDMKIKLAISGRGFSSGTNKDTFTSVLSA